MKKMGKSGSKGTILSGSRRVLGEGEGAPNCAGGPPVESYGRKREELSRGTPSILKRPHRQDND